MIQIELVNDTNEPLIDVRLTSKIAGYVPEARGKTINECLMTLIKYTEVIKDSVQKDRAAITALSFAGFEYVKEAGLKKADELLHGLQQNSDYLGRLLSIAGGPPVVAGSFPNGTNRMGHNTFGKNLIPNCGPRLPDIGRVMRESLGKRSAAIEDGVAQQRRDQAEKDAAAYANGTHTP